MAWVALVFIVVTAATAFASNPSVASSPTMWLVFGGAYAALTTVALWRLARRNILSTRVRYQGGDMILGAASGLALLVASGFASSTLAPTDTPRAAWLANVYAQLGEPQELQRIIPTLLLLGLVACEELVWRGMVLDALTVRLGPRRGWLAAALLYGLSLAPTMWTLAAPEAGLNPLPLLAGLGCGLVWTYLAARTGRLVPGLIAHAIFTYFAATQLRIPGL